MDFSIPEEANNFHGKVQAFRRQLAPRVAEMEREGLLHPGLLRECGTVGLTGMLIPSAFGGSDVGPIGYILAIEEISRASASLGALLSVHNSVGAFPINQFGSIEQKKEFLPALCSGEHLGGFAITEAGAGSDVSGIATNARREGAEFIINGIKIFITGKGDVFNLLVSTDRQKGSSGMTLFIVRKGDKGFRIGSKERKMGLHAKETCELIFEDCRVSENRILGKENEGFKQAMQVLDTGRIGIAAQAVGASRGALEEAVTVMQKRPELARNQALQFELSECATELDSAWLLVLKAADRKKRGAGTTILASMAKSHATTVANRIAHRLLGVLGKEFLAGPNPIERFFRDSKVFEIYEGTTEIHHLIISRRLMGSWPFEKELE